MSQSRVHKAASKNKWDTKLGHSPISEFCKLIYPKLGAATIKYIDENSFQYSLKKGEHLLRSTENCEYLYLVTKGAFRNYINHGSREITTWLTLENEMITSIRGLNSLPSIENIEALEDAEVIGASYKDLNYLYEHHPEMNVVVRKVLEQHYVYAEDRAYLGKLTSAATKYQYFISTRGDLSDRILLKYIASYLGMELETLSRIRTKFANGKKEIPKISIFPGN